MYRDSSENVWMNSFLSTRMHSSRMRTTRSSSGGVSTRHPLEQAPPRTSPPPGAGTPLGRDPQSRHPPCGQTHACKHITLPQTSFAGGTKKESHEEKLPTIAICPQWVQSCVNYINVQALQSSNELYLIAHNLCLTKMNTIVVSMELIDKVRYI